MTYLDFLDRKAQLAGDHGFAPDHLPDFLFDFQRELVEWALRQCMHAKAYDEKRAALARGAGE